MVCHHSSFGGVSVIDISESIEACANHYGEQAEAMRSYLQEGQAAALALPNRGPLRFTESGALAEEIRAAYSKYGFYVFENVLSAEELEDIKADLDTIRAQFPTGPESQVNAAGEPALGADAKALTLVWSKPLGDPLGGTELANGRHQVKMFEPEADVEAPLAAPFILLGSLQFSDACLRTYAHPELLKVTESINGPDFAPFNEALFIKEPGIGAAVSWHQDGVTHWDSPDFDEDIHGFNFMAQLYGCNAANGLWVLPGSHLEGKVDIRKLVDDAKSDRIEGAVPLICEPGDVAICNRQAVHGSFANTSDDIRVTINMGFHRRSSVLNVVGGGIHNDVETYTEERIASRSRLIGYAIDARKQEYPSEDPFVYTPMKEQHFVWDAAARESIRDYNLEDLGI